MDLNQVNVYCQIDDFQLNIYFRIDMIRYDNIINKKIIQLRVLIRHDESSQSASYK